MGKLLGTIFGYKILSFPDEKESLFKSIRYGMYGGLLALLIIDVGFMVLIFSLEFTEGFSHHADLHYFFDVGLIFSLILGSLLLGGWAAVLLGVVSSVLFYLLKPSILKYCNR